MIARHDSPIGESSYVGRESFRELSSLTVLELQRRSLNRTFEITRNKPRDCRG